MIQDPQKKYRPFAPVALTDRHWPDRVVTAPPVWLSTDLRDGNQALLEPMDGARKKMLFDLLCRIGFKEIEVGFPSASQTEFDFIRHLITAGRVPADVTISALTPARPELIRRTVAALRGARRAIVHVYVAIAPVFRSLVFGRTRTEMIEMAVAATCAIREEIAGAGDTEWVLEYSPETFSAAELDFSREICDAVVDAWAPGANEKVIINLPATVEMATPNVFADQVEWMHRNLRRRSDMILSVHPHNDRGTAVAAAELAMAAGAQRVEGCLFGHGERTGNVDLVTLALNLYTQGVHPRLDLSRIDEVARTVEHCTRLPVAPRHPYAGDLVFTAFSGSHQDAIKKGFAAQTSGAFWDVPYLPVDPADVGRSYDAVIRLNGQSGKGGVSYILERDHGFVLPRRLQIELSHLVKAHTDARGGEMKSADLWALFCATYLTNGDIACLHHELYDAEGGQGVRLSLQVAGQRVERQGIGNGPLDAAMAALGVPVRLVHYEEHALGRESGAEAAAFVELEWADQGAPCFGVGVSRNIVTASYVALMRGLDRLAAAHGRRWRVDDGGHLRISEDGVAKVS
ncbi:MAG: 2-isopropylmalate synthase [Gammaproteobacteria bacterium]|nr:2-isopropylmalate synthase [Gammaproteobacteria bacterium]